MRRPLLCFALLLLAGCDMFAIPAGDPAVLSSVPAEGAQDVSVGAAVKLKLNLPNGLVNLSSANENSVTLTDVASSQRVAARVQVDNDSERLVLKPSADLAYDTPYRFVLTGEVEDERGNAFSEYNSTFTTVSDDVPSVTGTTPYDGETSVSVYDTAAINSSGLSGVSGGVDPKTLTSANVYLTNLTTGERVSGTASTSGGGDTITFGLSGLLAEGTEYQFDVTSGVRSLEGAAFTPYTSTFITSGAGGENPSQPSDAVLTFQSSTNDVRHSSLAVLGTDLYASTIDGRILRYPISDDGSLGAAEQLTSLTDPDGNERLTVGFAFDPASTPDNPVAWVSSTGFTGFDGTGGIQNGNVAYRWSGKITRLSGPNLSVQQDVVVGLPRSSKDHVTNSIAFNPAEPGVLYFNQGSNTAMGAPDTLWRFQPERLLTGAVLRLNYQAVGSGTLNVKTEDGGTYDPYADGAPLTIYASGVRNAYDLVWHSNGHLYVPANGSAKNGTMPSYDPLPGTCENRPDGGYATGTKLVGQDALPSLRYITSGVDPVGVTVPVNGWTIPQTMNDYLFDVKEGGYYGSPNPKRCEWILYGGGVGTGNGDDKINAFPSSVEPDPNYRGYAYNFGQNISPNGAIEYKGDAFSQFKNKLLVVRYASGDNIVALGFDGSGTVSGEPQPVVGINSFADPIDLTEDPRTGYLYVSSYDQTEKNPLPTGITLVRPK